MIYFVAKLLYHSMYVSTFLGPGRSYIPPKAPFLHVFFFLLLSHARSFNPAGPFPNPAKHF